MQPGITGAKADIKVAMPLTGEFVFFALLAIVALLVALSRQLFASAMISSLISLLAAVLYTYMAAPDVALTEAVVGAGLTTVFFLMAIAHVKEHHSRPARHRIFALPLVLLTTGLLVYATIDLPPYGSPGTPAHLHVGSYYLENTMQDIGLPNVVTAVLASYRGFDTLGELYVIFAAALGAITIFESCAKNKK